MSIEIELREVLPNDAELIFASWGYNKENFKYLSASPQNSVNDSEVYLSCVLGNGVDPCFHILESGKTIGLIKAKVEGHKALVGYVINQSHWGKGFATAALTKFLKVLQRQSGLTRIWATCATNNPASAKVLEKCGFIREGVLKNWIVYPYQGDYAHDNFSYYLPTNV